MYISYNGERLTLSSWDYNRMRLMSHLATVIENNGGTVAPNDRVPMITNRSITENIIHDKTHLERMKAAQATAPNEVRAVAITRMETELAALAEIKNEPIPAPYPGFIHFKLDGMKYYFQTDSNPFFEHYFCKTPIRENNTFSRDTLLTEIPCTVAYDCMLGYHITAGELREIACQVFNALVAAPPSKVIRDSKRVRVNNSYDGGYHYETITAPERIGKMDF